jgi:hypothetical protein
MSKALGKPVGPFRLLGEVYLGSMAESQVIYPYLPEQLKAIRASISEPRFATYLAKAGKHEKYAIALYLYNVRVAKSFLFPLGVVEVTLRNAIDEILVERHGLDWHQDTVFRDEVLTTEGLATLDKAIRRAGHQSPRSQVVAELTFDFWSNLFRPEYGDLWRTTVNIAFPNLKHGETRHEIQSLVRPINAFRNRVAHHEPILDMNVTDVLGRILRLTGLRCRETEAWLKHHCTLNTVVRSRPKLDGSNSDTLSAKLDKNFVAVDMSTTLQSIIGTVDDKRQAIVCQDAAGSPTAAFTVLDVARYVSDRAKELDGMVDLSQHKVSDFLNAIDLAGRWTRMDEMSSMGLAVKELQKPRIQILVGTDVATGRATGAIVRAHRRY